jgi:hypothetical protein
MAADHSGDEATILWRAKVRTKDGRTATSNSVVVVPDATASGGDPPGRLGPQLFRFKVRTADGRERTSKVAVVRPPAPDAHLLKRPRWNASSFRHGGSATLSVEAPGLDGEEVRFVVERKDEGRWRKVAECVAPVSSGKATASVPVEHSGEGAPPVAQLRFRAQLVRG